MPIDITRPYPKRPRLLDKNSYIGIRGYLITMVTCDRKKFFTKNNIVQSMICYLQQTAEKEHFDVIAYCFMPDHLHLTLAGKNEHSDLLRFVKDYKQMTGFNFKKTFHAFLWDTSFHDHVLRKREDMKDVGRYSLRNPIESGMVKNILDYPFCGSFVYDLKELVKEYPYLNAAPLSGLKA